MLTLGPGDQNVDSILDAGDTFGGKVIQLHLVEHRPVHTQRLRRLP
jgi:hypothetical protein